MSSIITTLSSWRTARRRSRRLELHRRSVEQVARIAPEWGHVEVSRPVDATNSGPFMGWPTQ